MGQSKSRFASMEAASAQMQRMTSRQLRFKQAANPRTRDLRTPYNVHCVMLSLWHWDLSKSISQVHSKLRFIISEIYISHLNHLGWRWCYRWHQFYWDIGCKIEWFVNDQWMPEAHYTLFLKLHNFCNLAFPSYFITNLNSLHRPMLPPFLFMSNPCQFTLW